MRIYGRTPPDEYGQRRWVTVETDANGDSSYVYVVALCQCLLLNYNESPFWANFGIPAKSSVLQQQAPDYFVGFIVNYFSQFFASLTVTRQANEPNQPAPIYDIAVLFKSGVTYQATLNALSTDPVSDLVFWSGLGAFFASLPTSPVNGGWWMNSGIPTWVAQAPPMPILPTAAVSQFAINLTRAMSRLPAFPSSIAGIGSNGGQLVMASGVAPNAYAAFTVNQARVLLSTWAATAAATYLPAAPGVAWLDAGQISLS